MAHKYKTHYDINPCRRVGYNSKMSENKKEVDCMWCRAKNSIYPIKP